MLSKLFFPFVFFFLVFFPFLFYMCCSVTFNKYYQLLKDSWETVKCNFLPTFPKEGQNNKIQWFQMSAIFQIQEVLISSWDGLGPVLCKGQPPVQRDFLLLFERSDLPDEWNWELQLLPGIVCLVGSLVILECWRQEACWTFLGTVRSVKFEFQRQYS